MAIFVPEVAAPYLMKEIDKRLVISNAALDISADVPEIEWKGSEITFPVYSRVAVASQVDSKGSVTPTEIDGSSATAAIKHFAAAVKYHKDTLRQSGGPTEACSTTETVYNGRAKILGFACSGRSLLYRGGRGRRVGRRLRPLLY